MDGWIFVSNLVKKVIDPQSLMLLIFIISFVQLLCTRKVWAITSMSFAFGVVFLGVSPLASALYREHEQQYLPMPISESPKADAIVVLAGDVGIPTFPHLESEVRGNRVIHAMRLYHAHKAPLIVVSGGIVFPQSTRKPEASYIATLLIELGIPAGVMIVEGVSRNNRGNAMEAFKCSRQQIESHFTCD